MSDHAYKVYLVTSGEYSDYGIRRIFDNEGDAVEFCRIENGTDEVDPNAYGTYRVEEWGVDDKLPEVDILWHATKWLRFGIQAGRGHQELLTREVYWDERGKERPVDVYEYANGDQITVSATYRDQTKAIKAVADRAAAILTTRT